MFTKTIDVETVHIRVLFDTVAFEEGFGTGWGFSCVVFGDECTVLFDTGADGKVLLRNMEAVAIDPEEIDMIFLSHIHGDHTGGLQHFLERHHEVTVAVPVPFQAPFKKRITEAGADLLEVDDAAQLCGSMFSTGVLGEWIKEQALVVNSDRGPIVISGCAHPGIVRLAERASELAGVHVLCVMGGFHLVDSSKGAIDEVVSALKQHGVSIVVPCHCTGETAAKAFKRTFGDRCLEAGVGTIIEFAH